MREGLINNQDEKIDTLISVIMLTYNRQQFVGRMIECVLAQYEEHWLREWCSDK